jgi:hypothetical protein
MLSLPDPASVELALAGHLPERLRELLKASHLAAVASGLVDLTHYIVVEAGDSEDDLLREAGLSPLINPIDGARFGTDSFQPWWDWFSAHDGWFEMIITIGNSGFALILLIENCVSPMTPILSLCYQFNPGS